MSNLLDNFEPVATTLTAQEYFADIVRKQHVKIVGVFGPSASGKTTLSKELAIALGEDKSTVLKVDSYWRYNRTEMAERGLTGYDWETRDRDRFMGDLDALQRGGSIDKPVFDYAREMPAGTTVPFASADIIILEDTLDFTELADLTIFTYAPDEILITRRMRRDAFKTGFKDPQELELYLKEKSIPAYKAKLLPHASKVDYIVDTHIGVIYKNTVTSI
jgi:uridine kinase